jgi:hypothetical protein
MKNYFPADYKGREDEIYELYRCGIMHAVYQHTKNITPNYLTLSKKSSILFALRHLQETSENCKFAERVTYMAKALERELLQYILQLDEAEKKSVLQMLKTFLKGREKKLPRISIEQYNKEIDEAIARVEAGDYYTHEEVERMAKDW